MEVLVTSLLAQVSRLTLAFLITLTIGCAGRDIGNVVNYDKDARKTGLKLYNEREYAAAAGSFKAATRAEPRDYKAYYWLGACYDQLRNYNQAISSYKSSLSVMNLSFDGSRDHDFREKVIDALGIAVAKSDTKSGELDELEKTARSQQKAEPYYILAKAHRYSRDADSAIDNYNRALLLEPENFSIMREFGLYLEQLGQTQKAETTLRRAYALNSRDEMTASALRRLGVIPGPSIKEQKDLTGPIIPQGPIPELRLRDIESGQRSGSASTDTGPRDQ
jgi:tetratricopeptide (TPR) repeat protein